MRFTADALATFELIKQFDLSSLHDGVNGNNLSILVRCWVAMLLDSPLGIKKSLRLIKTELNLMRRDLRVYIQDNAILADKLANSLIVDDFGSFTVSLHYDFRRSPVFREYEEWFKTGDATLFQYILSFLLFGKKAEYVDPNLNEPSLKKWKENEVRLKERTIPDHLLADLRTIILKTGIRFDPQDFFPGFGPGTVSDRGVRKFSQKCDGVRYAPELDSYLNSLVGSDDSVKSAYIPNADLWRKGSVHPSLASVDISEQLFVVKDINSVRVIFREPNAKMYFQQGVLAMSRKAIEKTIYGTITKFEDQTRNQLSSRYASEDGEYSTIDLSSASDLVGEDLVRSIFPIEMQLHLFGTRTNQSKLTSGEIITTYRFAGMGSAVCFDLQCLVFGTVLLLANHLGRIGLDVVSYLERGEECQPSLHFNEWDCVYGDDIICLHSQTEALVSLLTTLGFIVNKSKSFYGSRALRESCGEYDIHGKDVTPLRFRGKGLSVASYDSTTSLIDLTNRSFKLGYFHLRQMVLDHIPRHRYCVVSEDSPYHGPYYVTDFQTDRSQLVSQPRKRIEKYSVISEQSGCKTTLGCYVWTPVKVVKAVVNPSVDHYLYHKWLHTPSLSDGSKPVIGDTAKTVLRRVWMPV